MDENLGLRIIYTTQWRKAFLVPTHRTYGFWIISELTKSVQLFWPKFSFFYVYESVLYSFSYNFLLIEVFSDGNVFFLSWTKTFKIL